MRDLDIDAKVSRSVFERYTSFSSDLIAQLPRFVLVRRLFLFSLFLAFSLFNVACVKEEIQVYTTPREDRSKTLSLASAEHPDRPHSHMLWQAPSYWVDKGSSGFRKGSFQIPLDNGAFVDLSIVSFPGESGGLLANVNRWRGQLALPPVLGEALPALLQTQRYPIGSIQIADIKNSADQRILVAVYQATDETWFFKLTGESGHISQILKDFETFLGTLREDLHE